MIIITLRNLIFLGFCIIMHMYQRSVSYTNPFSFVKAETDLCSQGYTGMCILQQDQHK